MSLDQLYPAIRRKVVYVFLSDCNLISVIILLLINVFLEDNLSGFEIPVIKFTFHFFVRYHITVHTFYLFAAHVLSQMLSTIFFQK